jgi:beta-mannosidase
MMSAGKRLKVHFPEWKAAVPRDLGAGWDFEDVRDHYLREFFDLDPTSLRSCDHDRYLELSRVVSGTAMAAAFREWRRGRSLCNGALVWFLRDLVPGAGWGILDSTGTGKAAWYQLRRVLQPRAVFLTDEGLNGLQVHVINEPAQALRASIEIEIYRDDGVRVASATRELTAPAHGNVEFPVLELFESFLDLTYAYRFGPPGHEVVVAALHDHATGQALGEDCYFPLGMCAMPRRDIGLAAVARLLDSGDAELTLTASACARFVSIRQNGFVPEDQYFHLIPGRARILRLRRVSPSAEVNGYVYALNSAEPVRIGIAA